MGRQLIFFTAVLFLVNGLVFAEDGPIVNTALGQIRGVVSEDGTYNTYMGIPYALVDENNPFGPSVPTPPFEGIFEANDGSVICPQLDEYEEGLAGTLDCLHLHIDVPLEASADNPLPVFIWIHGGRFELESAGKLTYGPEFLIRYGIILVTFNYRVGPYGFMCLDIPEVPGNQGLKDQHEAIRWIYENIAAFGGNPNNITIGGNSAGGISVDLHMLRNNVGQKYFNQALMQSGNAFSPSFSTPVKDAPIRMARALDFVTDDLYEALNFLKTVEPLVLINTTDPLRLSWRPCVEKYYDGVSHFITEDWFSMEKVENVKDMNILLGFNNHENYLQYTNRNFNYEMRTLLRNAFDVDNEEFIGMDKIVRHFFYGDEESGIDMLLAGVNMTSDLGFIHPTVRGVDRYLKNGAKDIYLYEFSYVGALNYMQFFMGIRGTGAWHVDEISYLFDIEFFPDPSPEEQLIIDRLTKLWTNFIKYGNPTPETSELLPVIWKPITSSTGFTYYTINTELGNSMEVFDRMAFWDLFIEANKHLQAFVVNNQRLGTN